MKDGTSQFIDGTAELNDGALQLLDGTGELMDGLFTFDEEGISKFSKEAKRLLDEQDTEEVLVMVDFLFGSPFNEFSKLASAILSNLS